MGILSKTYILFLQAAVIFAAFPPIEKCQLSDSSCLKKSAQNAVTSFVGGIPEVGNEPLDPLVLKSINIDLSGLNLNLKDTEIKGLKDTVIDTLSFDMAKKHIDITFHNSIIMKGKYKASGRLLILPIEGDGDSTIKIKNIEVKCTMPYTISKDANGKDVIELKSYNYTFDVIDNAHFRLTNLFNGNKELSDAMHKFINENWKAIAQEFGASMLEQPMEKIYNGMKTYLKSQPIESITIP